MRKKPPRRTKREATCSGARPNDRVLLEICRLSTQAFVGRERHHLDYVVGDHVDPSDEALVGDEGHEGRLPLEDEVDDESGEDPVEASPEHVERVQHADAEVQRAVGEERHLPGKEHRHRSGISVFLVVRVSANLVDVLQEEGLLVGGEDGRAEQAALVVLCG